MENNTIELIDKLMELAKEKMQLRSENNRLFESLEVERANVIYLQKQLKGELDVNNDKLVSLGRLDEQKKMLERENRELRDKIRELENRIQVPLTERTITSNKKIRRETGYEVENES